MKQTTINYKLLVVSLIAVLVTACATPIDKLFQDDGSELEAQDQSEIFADDTDPTDPTGADTLLIDDSSGSDVRAIADEILSAQELLLEADTALANRTIYFEFDSAKLTDESLTILEVHGSFVASNGEVNVRLEGHSDERGSREYNISLGDRRAQSVRRVLLFQGASADQIETVSYGEEKPAMSGHSEEAWSKNRRVELEYKVN